MTANNKPESSAETRCQGLESLLRKEFGADLSLEELSAEALLPLGENFMSELLRIEARVRRERDSPVVERLQLVGKLIIEKPLFKVDWTKLFKKEIFMYTGVVPLYREIELEHGVDEGETIDHCVARLRGHRMSLEPEVDVADKHAIILFENLKERGYYILDKKLGVDFEHARKSAAAIGRFHALGIVAKRKYPPRFEALKPKLKPLSHDTELLGQAFENVSKTLKQDSRFDKYSSYVNALIDEWSARNYEVRTANEPWATIVHNDFWTNNMMFRRSEEGRVDGVKFVDFQTYEYADPFLDLCYFFCTSLDDQVKRERFDELLDVHYEAFVSTLRRMDVEVEEFARDRYEEQMRRDARDRLLVIALALTFFTVEVDQEKETQDSVFSNIVNYKGNELYFKKVLDVLRIYERKGWLC